MPSCRTLPLALPHTSALLHSATHCHANCDTLLYVLPHTAALPHTADCYCRIVPHSRTAAHFRKHCLTQPCALGATHCRSHCCTLPHTAAHYCHTLPPCRAHCSFAAHCCTAAQCSTLPHIHCRMALSDSRTQPRVCHIHPSARTAAHCRVHCHEVCVIKFKCNCCGVDNSKRLSRTCI
jgi:hypothetical protein